MENEIEFLKKKIQERDAMIQKLKRAIYPAIGFVLQQDPGKACEILTTVINELAEWEKTK